MNLSEALDAALPEIPKARTARSRPPQLDPDLVIREDVLDGEPMVGILQREKANFFRLQPSQWQLAQLFDGTRSYEEIGALYGEQTGSPLTAEDVKVFAESLEECDFWYKTPQEKNMAMNARLMAARGRRAQRTSKINLAHISFSGWDPDRYLTWLDGVAGRFIYSRWCLLSAVALFGFEAFVFVSKWHVIGPDIPVYYNFTTKNFGDIAQFWMLLFVLGFIHESAHGLTCKHYGGEVHTMGLMFLYLTPAFFVDVTESWVSATRVQRLGTILAGIWVEMVVCGLAMIAWLNTLPGQWLHDFAYKVILITGLAVIVMNMNPLLKLDGYYFLTEAIGIPDLKERSTAFVTGWFQRHVLRMDAEVPAVPRRRAPFFALYALASGAYSYFVLYAVIRFCYNVSSKWLAEFALIPAGALAYLMFKGRLKSLAAVSKEVWQRNLGAGFRLRPMTVAAAAAVAALLFVPIWRDRESAYFVVEAGNPITLHAPVSGRVEEVLVREGDRVATGQPVLRMTSASTAAMRSAAEAATDRARYKAVDAEMRGQSIGAAAAEEAAAAQARGLALATESSLLLTAPANGVVLSDDPEKLLKTGAVAGQSLLAIAGEGPAVVRIYIPAVALDRVAMPAEVEIAPPGRFLAVRMTLARMEGGAIAVPAGVLPRQEYKGVEMPTFYSARLTPAGKTALELRIGSSGQAMILGRRRSVFERLAGAGLNLFHAHVW